MCIGRQHHCACPYISRAQHGAWAITVPGAQGSQNVVSALAPFRACCPQVGEADLDQALTAAVTCCILAAAGPQRSRVLANLYKDERCARLPVFPFLEKVYLERILRRQEVRLRCAGHLTILACQTADISMHGLISKET